MCFQMTASHSDSGRHFSDGRSGISNAACHSERCQVAWRHGEPATVGIPGRFFRAFSRTLRGVAHGQSMVEFALGFPILMAVILSIMELGIAVFSYNTIANAAYEGARYGTMHPAAVSGTCANPGVGIGEAACRLTAGLNSGRVSFASTVTSGVIRVQINYNHQFVSGPLVQMLGRQGVLALHAVAAMLVE